MATVETTVANLALFNIQVNKRIAALDEDRSAEAQTINAVFDHARQFVLRDGLWPFAKRYRTLALVEEDPVSMWEFSYRYPSDCLLARYIVDPAEGLMARKPIEYEIGGDDQGAIILTNQEDAQLCYTLDLDNFGRFDQMFVSAMSWYLAYLIGGPLSKTKGIVDICAKGYALARSVALQAAYNEEKRADPRLEAEWIAGRD